MRRCDSTRNTLKIGLIGIEVKERGKVNNQRSVSKEDL